MSLYPKTQEHHCRTQLISSHRRTKSLLGKETLSRNEESSAFERISLTRLEKNKIIFWWFVKVDCVVWHSLSWSGTSDITGSVPFKSGSNNHWLWDEKKWEQRLSASEAALKLNFLVHIEFVLNDIIISHVPLSFSLYPSGSLIWTSYFTYAQLQSKSFKGTGTTSRFLHRLSEVLNRLLTKLWH